MDEVVTRLRSKLGHLAVFFYNEYTPDMIGCLWRPNAFKGQPFTAMHSEYRRPILDNDNKKWEENSLVITNASDVMRVIMSIVQDVVVDVKILDDRSVKTEESDKEEDDKNGGSISGSSRRGLSGSKRGRSKLDTKSDSSDNDDDDDSSSSEEDSD